MGLRLQRTLRPPEEGAGEEERTEAVGTSTAGQGM